MAARGFLGAGDLYIRRLVAGVYGPWQGRYECDKFEIKPNVDTKEMVSKGRDTYGQVIETVSIPKPADLKVALSEVNKESLAIALLGTTSVVSQDAGNLTDVAIDDVVLDTWIPLEAHNFSGNPTLTNGLTEEALVTYTEGLDYIVEKTMGWLKVLSTGDLTGGEDLKFSTAYDAATGTQIAGMTDSQLRVQFRLEGKNFADGLPFRCIVYEAVIAADSAFDFLQSDFSKVDLPGRMKTPVGYTEPFIVVIDDPVVEA